MAKYMIHTMPKRLWYVEQYLIPSMIAQGINEDDIKVWNDSKGEGNLKACMNAFLSLPNDAEGTWHLQDDIIISHNFKATTEAVDFGIVCGFKSKYDKTNEYGAVPFICSWFSFLCIRIPNQLARQCAIWVARDMIGNPVYKEYWEKSVNDDWMFRQFINTCHKDMLAINLRPNIVDHIDYLIGGTVTSNAGITKIRSEYWEDEYLVKELEKRLKNDNNNL